MIWPARGQAVPSSPQGCRMPLRSPLSRPRSPAVDVEGRRPSVRPIGRLMPKHLSLPSFGPSPLNGTGSFGTIRVSIQALVISPLSPPYPCSCVPRRVLVLRLRPDTSLPSPSSAPYIPWQVHEGAWLSRYVRLVSWSPQVSTCSSLPAGTVV